MYTVGLGGKLRKFGEGEAINTPQNVNSQGRRRRFRSRSLLTVKSGSQSRKTVLSLTSVVSFLLFTWALHTTWQRDTAFLWTKIKLKFWSCFSLSMAIITLRSGIDWAAERSTRIYVVLIVREHPYIIESTSFSNVSSCLCRAVAVVLVTLARLLLFLRAWIDYIDRWWMTLVMRRETKKATLSLHHVTNALQPQRTRSTAFWWWIWYLGLVLISEYLGQFRHQLVDPICVCDRQSWAATAYSLQWATKGFPLNPKPKTTGPQLPDGRWSQS